VRFAKVEGAGNDYVLIDEFDHAVADPPYLARRMSDRHLGIGSDGLLLVGPASGRAEARMRIFNADGSEGRMCGNGLRCVVRYLLDSGRAKGPGVIVETASGLRQGRLDGDGAVEVDMGRPCFDPASLPADLPWDGRKPLRFPLPERFARQGWQAYAVSVGNPHLVVCVDDLQSVDLPRDGGTLQAAPQLEDGANVQFCSALDDRTQEALPWELGSGATRACGTGAVAVAAVSRALAKTPTDARPTRVHMPGGWLSVRFDAEGAAWLSGPANLVYRGDWPELS
jgi:diaminopimelate epimerase